MVGAILPISIDLSAARPTRTEHAPDSTLVVSVLATAPAGGGADGNHHHRQEPLVVWSTEQRVAATAESTTVELGPLSVAGR